MRHDIAYGIIALLLVVVAAGLWRLRKSRRRSPRHIHVDLTGSSDP